MQRIALRSACVWRNLSHGRPCRHMAHQRFINWTRAPLAQSAIPTSLNPPSLTQGDTARLGGDLRDCDIVQSTSLRFNFQASLPLARSRRWPVAHTRNTEAAEVIRPVAPQGGLPAGAVPLTDPRLPPRSPISRRFQIGRSCSGPMHMPMRSSTKTAYLYSPSSRHRPRWSCH